MKNLEGKTAVLYMRVSTKEQKIHGNSLEVQKSRLKSFCERKNVQVIREFTAEA
jgi:DNA invertase Pin-like site-specific DNA recombinase